MNVSASVPIPATPEQFRPRGRLRPVPSVAIAACPPTIPRVPDLDVLLVLVRKIASWFERRWGLPAGWDHDDLVHEGVVGLMKSLQRFDPARGACAETFCGYGVRGSLFRRAGERWDQVNHEAPPPDEEQEGPWPLPERAVLNRELQDAVFVRLNATDQTLVIGRLDEQTFAELGRQLRMPIATVRRRLIVVLVQALPRCPCCQRSMPHQLFMTQ